MGILQTSFGLILEKEKVQFVMSAKITSQPVAFIHLAKQFWTQVAYS